MGARRVRIVGWVCAATMTMPATSVRAAPSTTPTASTPAAEPTPLDRAEALYRKGVARYEISEFDEALVLWTEAFAILEPTAENRRIRNDLVYNIARAQVQAYRIDADTRRLRQAKQLLERYVEVYLELSAGDPGASAEVQRAELRISEIDEMLRDAEKRERAERDRLQRQNANGAAGRQAKALVISGAIGTAIGIVGASIAFAGIGIGVRADRDFERDPDAREQARRRGRQANVMVASGAAVGIAFLAAGITLLALGRRNQKRLRVGATAGRGQLGVALGGRF